MYNEMISVVVVFAVSNGAKALTWGPSNDEVGATQLGGSERGGARRIGGMLKVKFVSGACVLVGVACVYGLEGFFLGKSEV
jgi:hypothetical protein